MTTKTPAAAEIEKWLRVRFFSNFWLRDRIRVRKTTQNPAGVDSGSGPTCDLHTILCPIFCTPCDVYFEKKTWQSFTSFWARGL